VTVGSLSSLTLSYYTVTAGGGVYGTVTLKKPVDTPTDVALAALDPEGGIVLGERSDAVSLPDSVTIPAGETTRRFTIHANDVTMERHVTIVASALHEKRAHLTVQR
jgi:hypothetical protein